MRVAVEHQMSQTRRHAIAPCNAHRFHIEGLHIHCPSPLGSMLKHVPMLQYAAILGNRFLKCSSRNCVWEFRINEIAFTVIWWPRASVLQINHFVTDPYTSHIAENWRQIGAIERIQWPFESAEKGPGALIAWDTADLKTTQNYARNFGLKICSTHSLGVTPVAYFYGYVFGLAISMRLFSLLSHLHR